MSKPRRKLLRVSFAQATEREVAQAWKDALTFQPNAVKDLQEIVQMQSYDGDALKMAFNEGYRSLAGRLLTFFLQEPDEGKVKRNIDDA